MPATYTGLVLVLDLTERCAELRVVRHREKLSNLLEVDKPVLRAKSVGDELRKARVALQQPTGHMSVQITR